MTPEELYLQNEDLVYWALHKYYPDFVYNEDLVQEGRIGLWRACLAYNEEKEVVFSTLAVPYIRNALRHGYEKLYGRSLGKRELLRNTISLYMPVTYDKDCLLQDILPGDMDVGFLDISEALSEMSDRDQQMLNLWAAGYSANEIAKKYEVSRGIVYRVIKVAERIFRTYI